MLVYLTLLFWSYFPEEWDLDKKAKFVLVQMSSFSTKVSLMMDIKGGGYILNREKYFLSR